MTLGLVICARNVYAVAVESFFSIFSLSAFVATLVHLNAMDEAVGETVCIRAFGVLGMLVVTDAVVWQVVGVMTFIEVAGDVPYKFTAYTV